MGKRLMEMLMAVAAIVAISGAVPTLGQKTPPDQQPSPWGSREKNGCPVAQLNCKNACHDDDSCFRTCMKEAGC